MRTAEHDAVADEHMDLLLKAAHGSGPDPFLADRLLQAVKEPRRSDTGRPTPRLVAAAVLLGAVCVVGLFGWQAQQQRLAQDPKLQKAVADLHETGQRTEAALIIHRAGAVAVPPLIQALSDKDPEYIEAVQELLAAAGKPAVAPLRDLIKGENRLLQLRAIQTLNLMGAEATPAIVDLLPVLEQAGAPRQAITTLGTLVAYSTDDEDRSKLDAALMAAIYTGGGPLSKPQPHDLVIRAVRRAKVENRDNRGHLHDLLTGDDPFQREFAAQLLAQ